MHRILLVEDDPDVAPILEQMLLSAGYRVSTVGTVAGATLLLDHRAHDLLLTDVNLPDGNGIAVADRAKSEGVKTILVTGYALQLPPEELRRHEYLMKPVRSGELLAAVKRVLDSTPS
jgi:DNA-binding response OmpR family regulator